MIGDWVYDTHSYNYNKEKEPVKLSRNEFVELLCGCTGNNDLDLGDMYEPIPLTEKMLVANGFKMAGRYEWEDGMYVTRYRYRNEDVLFELNYTPDYDGFNAKGIDVNMVHILQHLLRLKGLVDLADNFKIQ